MRKNLAIISLSTILVFLFFYMNLGKSIEYEALSTEDAPDFIQTVIQETKGGFGFSIFQDETNTYIYYKSDAVSNEYITTDLDVKGRGEKYIVTATVQSAVNIPNGDRLIKLNKVTDKDITLVTNIK